MQKIEIRSNKNYSSLLINDNVKEKQYFDLSGKMSALKIQTLTMFLSSCKYLFTYNRLEDFKKKF